MSTLVAVVLGLVGVALIIAGVNNSGLNVFRAAFGGGPVPPPNGVGTGAGNVAGATVGPLAGRKMPDTSRTPGTPQ